jgi:hypothetical protein
MHTDLDTLIALFIIGLGTARLTAIIVLDEITDSLRDLVFYYFPPEDNDAKGWYYQCYHPATREQRAKLENFKGRLHWWQRRFDFDGTNLRRPHFIGRLLACHKCVGVWVAAANTAFYLLAPEFALGFNFALAASFLSIILIGKYWR